MKPRIILIYFNFLILIFFATQCLAEKINYLDNVYYKNSGSSGNIMLDEKIINVFKDELKKNHILKNSEFEVAEINISPNNINVYENNYKLYIVDPPLVTPGGYAIMILNLFENGSKTKSIKVTGKIKIPKDLFCAAYPLSKNQIISENDIIPCVVDISEIKGSPCEDMSQIVGKEVKFSIPAGKVLGKRALKVPVIIKRGDKVAIISKTENLTVRTEGEAMQNGSKGSLIKVRNITANKDLIGKIIDANTVQVGF
jgi:flagella basal body P-ring formation protein FlgA